MPAGNYAPVSGWNATANDAVPTHKLGQTVQVDQRVFKYVQHRRGNGSVAAVAGQLAYNWSTGQGTIVTSDNTNAVSSVNGGAGFYQNAITDLYHGWIQIYGSMNAALITTQLGGNGDLVVDGSTTDGNVVRVAQGTAPTHNVLGIMREASASNTKKIFVTIARS